MAILHFSKTIVFSLSRELPSLVFFIQNTDFYIRELYGRIASSVEKWTEKTSPILHPQNINSGIRTMESGLDHFAQYTFLREHKLRRVLKPESCYGLIYLVFLCTQPFCVVCV